jgi:uncharacterized protein YjeT (DUF2065 family)
MLKWAAAFAAITTVASALVCPQRSQAQDAIQPLKPGPVPQKIDIPASSSQSSVKPGTAEENGSDIDVPAGTTVDEINAYGCKVTIAGTVRHNVFVNNGHLTLLKSANVLGHVEVANNSTVDNSSTCQVTIVNAPPADVPTSDSDDESTTAETAAKKKSVQDLKIQTPLHSKPNWVEAQLALAILGVLGAALAVIVAPSASRKVADHISDNPKKDLRLGSALGVAMLLIVIGDSLLLKMPLIKYFWAPFGIMIAYAPVLILGFGWIVGMRFAAEKLAARFQWCKMDSLFKSICIGVAACGLANMVLGSINITFGVFGLLFELGFALMGLGGLASVAMKSASNGRY